MNPNNLNIDQLIKLSRKFKAQASVEISLLDKTFEGMLKNLPEDEANEVDRLRTLTQKAINLSKDGKEQEAQDLIRNYSNGSKGNK